MEQSISLQWDNEIPEEVDTAWSALANVSEDGRLMFPEEDQVTMAPDVQACEKLVGMMNAGALGRAIMRFRFEWMNGRVEPSRQIILHEDEQMRIVGVYYGDIPFCQMSAYLKKRQSYLQ